MSKVILVKVVPFYVMEPALKIVAAVKMETTETTASLHVLSYVTTIHAKTTEYV